MHKYGVTVGAMVAVLLTGCSGSSGGSGAAPTTPGPKPGSPEAAVEAAVKAYSHDVVSGAGAQGYKLVSKRCKKIIDAAAFDEQAAQAKANYPGAAIVSISVDDLSGKMAHVSYTYANAVLNQTHKAWLKETGGWHWDAC